jgi:hypothetical protein
MDQHEVIFQHTFLTVSHPDNIIRRIIKHEDNKFNTQRHIKHQKWVKVDTSGFWIVNITLPIATIIAINNLLVLQATSHEKKFIVLPSYNNTSPVKNKKNLPPPPPTLIVFAGIYINILFRHITLNLRFAYTKLHSYFILKTIFLTDIDKFIGSGAQYLGH